MREAGYRAVLAEAGIEPIVGTVNFHTPEPRRTQQIDAWLSRWLPNVDGVFATDDLMAGTVLEWAAQSGVAVPDQLRVVGFDGTEAIRRAYVRAMTLEDDAAALRARQARTAEAAENGVSWFME